MNGRCIISICTLAVFIVLNGCGKVDKPDDDLATEPVAQMVTLPSEFASRAIDKIGGLDSWGQVKELKLDCVVTFYNMDSGHYLTEQSYSIYPWSDSIVISGKESQNQYKWQLQEGQFSIIQGTGQVQSSINQVDKRCFAELILSLMSVPARFLDNSVVFSRGSSTVNVQGKWCYPVTSSPKAGVIGNVSVNDAVFYQNKDSLMVDAVMLTCKNANTALLICGNDYQVIEDGEVLIPYRIEVYQTDKNGLTQRRLVQIDIYSAEQI